MAGELVRRRIRRTRHGSASQRLLRSPPPHPAHGYAHQVLTNRSVEVQENIILPVY